MKKLFFVASQHYDALKIGMKRTIKFIDRLDETEDVGGQVVVWREYLYHKVYYFRHRDKQTTFSSTWNCLAPPFSTNETEETFKTEKTDPVGDLELVSKVPLGRFLRERFNSLEIVTLVYSTSLTRQFLTGFGGLCFIPKHLVLQ